MLYQRFFLVALLSSAIKGSEDLNKKFSKKIQQKSVLVSTLKNFLDKKADPNAFCGQKGLSIFHILLMRAAAKESLIKRVELLLDYKADVNLKDKGDCSPLDHLCLLKSNDKRSEYLIKLLMKHNADPNSKGFQGAVPLVTLFGVRCDGWRQKVKVFLECKADLNLRYDEDKTPLHYFFDQAISFDKKMVQMFIDYGADQRFFEKRFGPIVLADQSLTLLRFGLACDLDFNTLGSSKFDELILYSSVYDNTISLDIVNLLLQYGLNPCLKLYNDNFAYEEAHVFQKIEKRNMLAYAIPRYIYQKNKKTITSLETFLLCLRSANKQWKLIIPKPIVCMIRDQIFDFKLVDMIIKTIKRIESDSHWFKDDAEYLKGAMQTLIDRFG